MEPKKTTYFTTLAAEDPEGFRNLSARGGLTMVARHGRDSNTSKARAATRAREIAQVDPDGTLSPEELATRLADLMRARILKMNEARRRNRALREAQRATS